MYALLSLAALTWRSAQAARHLALEVQNPEVLSVAFAGLRISLSTGDAELERMLPSSSLCLTVDARRCHCFAGATISDVASSLFVPAECVAAAVASPRPFYYFGAEVTPPPSSMAMAMAMAMVVTSPFKVWKKLDAVSATEQTLTLVLPLTAADLSRASHLLLPSLARISQSPAVVHELLVYRKPGTN